MRSAERRTVRNNADKQIALHLMSGAYASSPEFKFANYPEYSLQTSRYKILGPVQESLNILLSCRTTSQWEEVIYVGSFP